MGTTRSPECGYTEKEVKTFWDMTDVFCYPALENDKCEVLEQYCSISSDKILYFLFSPVSFLISTDPVMSKFVPVIPTLVINIFPIDVYYCQDVLKTQIFVVGCWLLYNSDEYFSSRVPNQRAPNRPTWDQERFIAVIKE